MGRDRGISHLDIGQNILQMHIFFKYSDEFRRVVGRLFLQLSVYYWTSERFELSVCAQTRYSKHCFLKPVKKHKYDVVNFELLFQPIII